MEKTFSHQIRRLKTQERLQNSMVNVSQQVAPNLSFSWEDLLTLLRDELQEYGGLIGLLSAQQQSILNRRPDSLMELNQSVQTQMEASQILHKRRQGFVTSLAERFGESKDSTLSEIVNHFPDVFKTLPCIIKPFGQGLNLVKKFLPNCRFVRRGRKLLKSIKKIIESS